MTRILASWRMIVAELSLGIFAGGFLLPSTPADGPTQHKIATVLLVITVCLLLASCIALLRVLLREQTRYHRTRDGLCLRCGYDLTGNVSGICPECGKEISRIHE